MKSLQRLNKPFIALLATLAIAGGFRFYGLSNPKSLVFDEFYYPKAACIYAGWSNETCQIKESAEKYWRTNQWDVGSWVHPPLGKWQIMVGIKLFGMNSFGWRFMGALEGTLIAVMVAGMAQLMFRRPIWTFMAGLLVALEGLNVVMARTALLDVHLEFWVVLGFLFMLVDRLWIDRRTPPDAELVSGADAEDALDAGLGGGLWDPASDDDGVYEVQAANGPRLPSPVWRPWRFAAGVAFGAATAVKWDGAMALFGAVILAFIWEVSRRHRGETRLTTAALRTVVVESFGLIVALAIVPLAVYMLAWLPHFNHFHWNLAEWWNHQFGPSGMWEFHKNLKELALDTKTNEMTPTHSDYSRPWQWLFLIRPVNMFQEWPDGHTRQILAMGNPALIWVSLWTLPFAAWSWRKFRDWHAGFILVPALAMWLPWFLVSRPQFFFYLLPVTPFLALAATYMMRWAWAAQSTPNVAEEDQPAPAPKYPLRVFVGAFVALVVAMAVWFAPVWLCWELTLDAHHLRMWWIR